MNMQSKIHRQSLSSLLSHDFSPKKWPRIKSNIYISVNVTDPFLLTVSPPSHFTWRRRQRDYKLFLSPKTLMPETTTSKRWDPTHCPLSLPPTPPRAQSEQRIPRHHQMSSPAVSTKKTLPAMNPAVMDPLNNWDDAAGDVGVVAGVLTVSASTDVAVRTHHFAITKPTKCCLADTNNNDVNIVQSPCTVICSKWFETSSQCGTVCSAPSIDGVFPFHHSNCGLHSRSQRDGTRSDTFHSENNTKPHSTHYALSIEIPIEFWSIHHPLHHHWCLDHDDRH